MGVRRDLARSGGLLLHDEQVVKPSQEEIAFFRGFVPVSPLELLVVANDRNDVDWLEVIAEHRE